FRHTSIASVLGCPCYFRFSSDSGGIANIAEFAFVSTTEVTSSRQCRVVPLTELLPGSILVQTCATREKDVRMTETLQTAGLPRQGVRKQTAAALPALGVVYGDIGTSTLYGLKQAVEAAGG